MVNNKDHPIMIIGGGIKSNLEKALKDYIEFTLYGKTKDGITIYDFLKGHDYRDNEIHIVKSRETKKRDI